MKLSNDLSSKEHKHFPYGIISDPTIKSISNVSQIDLFKIFINNKIKDDVKYTQCKSSKTLGQNSF